MKHIKHIVLTTLTLSFVTVYSYGPGNGEKSAQESGNSIKSKAANCAPSAGKMFLEYNNVKTTIETSGYMWEDRTTGRPSYEVPKAGGRHVIYAGALWMGGTTPGGILKVAAHLYHRGNDFWAGPLTSNIAGDGVNSIGFGEGQIDPATCNLYDRFWVTTRNEVAAHYACKILGECPSEGYVTPESIRNWPGNYIDDGSKYVDYFLAPFVDVNDDLIYDAEAGDYPGYDLFKSNDCPKPRGGRVDLFGDYNIWYVFNDRGNVHTETGGQDIGMEIKAQAFAFSTTDEINSMTFYNYELINRATVTLTNTYFGQYVDADIGCSGDDYAGCDVQRGFGYTYNGTAVDGAECFGAIPYNDGTPPAIGVDFFEGPYQDNDGVDNPLTTDIQQAIDEKGIPYPGIGIGYSDGVVDNERFGMSRFVYFVRTPPIAAMGDPSNAIEYYNFMRGVWRDGSQFVFGGNGHISSGGSIPAKYMFPGDSDPLHWGTNGQPVPQDWTEANEGTVPQDRRFFQSSGPFTLEPGALNNITVGVVYARAASGDPFASVNLVRLADDKAQRLFDNCFRLIDGPDAPDVAARELDREIILYLTNNSPLSNNFGEKYIEEDPNIALDPNRIYLDTVRPSIDPSGTGRNIGGTGICPTCYYQDDNKYRFQGYQVFQLASEGVGAEELDDISKARLVAQCDLKDGIKRLINFEFDEFLQAPIPTEKVNGTNNGIVHTFKITTDAFAQGDTRLVNFKKYYFMVVAYAANNFREYNLSNALFLDGQQKPYLRGRKAAASGIQTVIAIPSKPLGGVVLNSQYGSTPIIIREEGRGNGGVEVDITAETEEDILANGVARFAKYKQGAVPVDFKIVDPLKVPNDEFELRFVPDLTQAGLDDRILYSKWALISRTTKDTVWSDTTISFRNEQLLLKSKASKFNDFGQFVDIDWGFSISITQPTRILANQLAIDDYPNLLSSKRTFSDTTKPWLSGIRDNDGNIAYNWIRSGTVNDPDATGCDNANDRPGDPEQNFEKVINGSWAPFALVANGECFGYPLGSQYIGAQNQASLNSLTSVDIVITSDQSKWTRCAVIEMQNESALSFDKVAKSSIRKAPSVGKNGLPDASGTTGMGWFPGYAIDVNTGERLNMAFGEDTWDAGHNGNDMKWNPTSSLANYGGKHYIYVFRNEQYEGANRMPFYDQGKFLMESLQSTSSATRDRAWRSCVWVGAPLLVQGQEFLSTDVRIRLRVSSAYRRYSPDKGSNQDLTNVSSSRNDWYPLYSFNTAELAHEDFNLDSAQSALNRINIVPNPYYAYSEYEERRLDTRVKIINLPQTCTIRIYNASGTLIRTFKKDSQITFVDWDLNNQRFVPIASGMYIIHVDVPGVGEKVIKWLGIMRVPDLENQ
jgi:hypothetical protein